MQRLAKVPAMSLDTYQLCPGGMNKKIKFCACGKDLLSDLNKILDALAGGQRVAAISQIDRLVQSHEPRACLLAIRGMVELEMGNLEGLAATTQTYLGHFPENPIALAYAAILAASDAEPEVAITRLQQSLEASQGSLHESTYAALGIVGRLLTHLGDYLAAFGHLSLQASVAPEGDNSAWEVLRALYSSNDISLLFKYHPVELSPPEGAAWAQQFHDAEAPAKRGCWRQACDRLAELSREVPDEAVVLQRLAMYHGWLGHDQQTAQSLHRLASLDALDLDTAIEAEATAQLLTAADRQTVDEVAHTYPISDADRVMERLLSEKQVARMVTDLSQLATDQSPPPRGAFWLLDRAEPATGQDLQLHEIPNVLGEMYLYGRETSREARVEFVTLKSTDYDTKRRAFEGLLAEFGTLEKEEPIRQVPAESAALTWRWRLPDDTPRQTRNTLLEEKRRDIYLNVWPETPLAVLDGKRPSEVAGDPAYRVRLLAAILLLELESERTRSTIDFNELRAKLGLPLHEAIDPRQVDLQHLPPTRLHLLQVEHLTDQQLAGLMEMALMLSAVRAVQRLGQELLRRPAWAQPAERARVLGMLSAFADNMAQSLEYNRQAQEAAQAAGQSPANWLLREMEMRLIDGDSQRASEVFALLQTRHLQEPGVAQALHALLVRVGAIPPEGRGGQAAPRSAPDRTGGAPESPAAPQGLWTPGGQAPPGGAGEKPKIWTPGMD
jgi:hypothetical protein